MRPRYFFTGILILILMTIWEAEFFVLDILPRFKAQAAEPPQTPQVVINEIAWMGTIASAADEWIELFNNTNSAINLSNWQLVGEDSKPNIIFGIAGSTISETIPANGYYLIERTNDHTVDDIGADLLYKGELNNSGARLILLDKDGVIVDELNNITGWFAGDTNPRITMERIDPQGDSNDSNNWANNNQKIFNGQDAKGKSIWGTPKQKNSVSYPKADTTPTPNYIFLNEIFPNTPGKDEEEEFIELFNAGDTTADLSNIEFQDEKQDKFILELGITIPALSYRAFYTGKKVTLNNDGDVISLLKGEQILNKIDYSKAPKGESYNRQDDGNWAWSTTTTPGLQNKITQKTAVPETSQTYPRHIWISEFLPNPAGRDTENEFIEIYNNGPDEIDLENWQIDDCENKGSKPHTFPENKKIAAGEYLSLPYSETKIALNNDEDCVRLLWPGGTAIDEIEYADPPEGQSYNKLNDRWCWSTSLTPGEQNNCSDKNSEKETKEYSRQLWINEFLPDPKGKDTEGEFIELQNRGDENIDLSAWQIDDCENIGSKPYTFPEDAKIEANGYLALNYQDTKINLNNDGDCVRLITPEGQIIDEIEYNKAPEGQSYSRKNVNHWQWATPSPNQDNNFPQVLAAATPTPLNPPSGPLRQSVSEASRGEKSPLLPQTGPNLNFYYVLGLTQIIIFLIGREQKSLFPKHDLHSRIKVLKSK